MRRILLSTALVAATSFPALAQDTNRMFRAEADPMNIHASEFIGMRVYRSEGADADAYEGVQDDWDDIGEINDVILSRDGNVDAVLVDIGGFLGMGENQVAVDMSSIRFASDSATADDTSDFFLVLNAPRDVLETAPKYEWSNVWSTNNVAAAQGTSDAVPDKPLSGERATSGSGQPVTDDVAAAQGASGEAVPEKPLSGERATSASAREVTQREGYTIMDRPDMTSDRLTGASVYDLTDERVGEVSELLLASDGTINSVVVDVGGFLGIGEKPVQLDMANVDILRANDDSDVRIYVAMTKEEMESLPEFQR
jgi:sporulation protein YlmC with PRC-barrel domain